MKAHPHASHLHLEPVVNDAAGAACIAAALFTRLVERREDTFTSEELGALAFALERHAEGVAAALRDAVETLRLDTNPKN